ncbi:O-antigen translocase [Kordia jejudonensis]|uniref:O-antigen translocase n=1 Tax=Kordia jejudonensis TaxID=1348245 RepID=UPI00062952A0|nr:O-antigen translocase [Kordia jejudonensis]
MNKLKKHIANNLLLKVTSFNSIAILINVLVGVLTSKALAEFVGTKGMASVGNLRDFLKTIYALATLGISAGIIKYTAEHKHNQSELQKVLSTALGIIFAATVLVSTLLFFGADYWNELIFKGKEFSYIFKILAFVLPLYTLNVLCLGIINGFEKYKKIITLNIIGYIANLLCTVYLVWKHALDGALISLSIVPSFLLIFSLILLYRECILLPTTFNTSTFSKDYAKKYLSYTLMAAVSAFIFPMIYVFVRNHVIETIGEAEAGYWEAMQRISNQYLIFVTSLLTLYVLPKLSENKTIAGFRTIVFNFYKTILPVFTIGLIIIYVARIWVIEFIYNEEFLPAESLFFWQLLGDFFKVISLVIAYQLFAKKMLGYYLFVEISSLILFYSLSIYFTNQVGIEGVVMAHCARSFIALILLITIFRKSLFSKIETEKL